jgi:hypothetical protein
MDIMAKYKPERFQVNKNWLNQIRLRESRPEDHRL